MKFRTKFCPLDFMSGDGNPSNTGRVAECSRPWRMGLSFWLESPILKHHEAQANMTKGPGDEVVRPSVILGHEQKLEISR